MVALAPDRLAFDDSPNGERLHRFDLVSDRGLVRSLGQRRATIVIGPLSVVNCTVGAVDGPSATSEPTDANENVTNELTDARGNATNEPTVTVNTCEQPGGTRTIATFLTTNSNDVLDSVDANERVKTNDSIGAAVPVWRAAIVNDPLVHRRIC
jgi:hypothetical protein